MKLRERFWLWGQTAGCHHNFGVPGYSRMTPLEGCMYFGIPNMFRVLYAGIPRPPFDFDADKLECLERLVYSIIGDGSSGQKEYTDAVLDVAKTHKNVVGGVMDDIFREVRMKMWSPEDIGKFREKLHTGNLPLWSVIYEYELLPDRIPYIAQCDMLTLWHWDSKNLPHIEENLEKLRALAGGQKIYCGLYIWDYCNFAPMPEELMKLQLDTFDTLMREGRIEGVVVCSNNVADVGLKAPLMLREYLKKHGDDEF